MSDSNSAPAAAPAETPAPSSPAPATQDAISISEAGRLLAKQRTEQRGQQGDQPGQPPRQGEPSRQRDAAAAPDAAKPAGKDGPSAADDMAKALGLPDGAAPPPSAVGQAEPAPALELDGQRYTQEQMRTALAHARDYTKKTQELADGRRQLESQQQALAQVLPLLQNELATLSQRVQGIPPPDAALIDSDPQTYLRQRAAYEQAQMEQQRLGELTALQQQAQARAMTEQVERSNSELAKLYPQWNDPATRAQWQQEIAAWAQEKGGFSRQELHSLTDHRYLQAMMKAMQFDRLVGGVRTQAPPQAYTVPARGVPPPPAPAEQVSRAEDAFGSRPNVRNAALLLGARRSNANGSGRER